jgi:hypothetical protein
MKKSFHQEFMSNKEYMKKYLPEDLIAHVDHVVTDGERFDANLWAKIVYQYASSFKHLDSDADKYTLLDTLKTLWLGRFVSYAHQVQDMDINEAEIIIQKQAEVFEEQFNYLKNIY